GVPRGGHARGGAARWTVLPQSPGHEPRPRTQRRLPAEGGFAGADRAAPEGVPVPVVHPGHADGQPDTDVGGDPPRRKRSRSVVGYRWPDRIRGLVRTPDVADLPDAPASPARLAPR